MELLSIFWSKVLFYVCSWYSCPSKHFHNFHNLWCRWLVLPKLENYYKRPFDCSIRQGWESHVLNGNYRIFEISTHLYKSQTVVTLHKANFSTNWCGICFLYSSKRENFYINSFAWVGLYKSYKTLLETFKRNVFKHFVENFPSLNL